MEKIKIFEAEMHLMNRIWDEGTMKAIDLANWATENLGWKKNSTYSMLKKLLEKGALRRDEPGFVLTPLVTRSEIQDAELEELSDRMFQGRKGGIIAALTRNRTLSQQQAEALRALIESIDEEA